MIEKEVITRPTGNSLRGEHLRAAFNWQKNISELIDNSFDAKAIEIIIERPSKNERTFRITDNGIGCDDLQRMVRQGESFFYSPEGIGKYGVGGKDVAIALWGTEQIISFSKNKLGMTEITWDDMCERDYPPTQQFWYPPSEVTSDLLRAEGINFKSGTRIVYRDVGISRIPGFQAKKRMIGQIFAAPVLDELSFRFQPALIMGCSIKFIDSGKEINLEPWKEPKFIEKFEFKNEEIEEKFFNIRGGIVAEGEINDKHGFHLCYSHRVIETTEAPCGEFGSSRIFAWVELSKDWILSRNKDEIIDEDREILFERISTLCSDYICRASYQNIAANIDGLQMQMTNEFSDFLKKCKEKRENGEEERTIKPKNTEKKRIYILNTQKGINPLRSARADQIKIQFAVLSDKKLYDVSFGEMGGIDWIYLNKINLKIDQYKKENNIDALRQIAIGAYATATVLEKKGQLALRFPGAINESKSEIERIEDIVWRFTKTIQIETQKRQIRVNQ